MQLQVPRVGSVGSHAAATLSFQSRLRRRAAQPARTRCRAAGNGGGDPFAALGLAPGAGKAEARSAYLQAIRREHPDVSGAADATQRTAALNAAYEAVLEAMGASRASVDEELRDEFDRCVGEPDRLFVNPWACTGVDPLQWEELQEAASADLRDPLAALSAAGVAAPDSAAAYVTPEQLAALQAELRAMNDTWAVEASRYYVNDCLARARLVNGRAAWARG